MGNGEWGMGNGDTRLTRWALHSPQEDGQCSEESVRLKPTPQRITRRKQSHPCAGRDPSHADGPCLIATARCDDRCRRNASSLDRQHLHAFDLLQ
jgi:hypothetical protein